MKRIIVLFTLSVFIVSHGFAQKAKKKDPQAFTVTVDVSAIKPMPVTLYFSYFKMTPQDFTMSNDSIEVIEGKALIKGTVAEPSLALLQTKHFGATGRFMLAPGLTTIISGKDISILEVPGSLYQKDLESLYSRRDEYEKNVMQPIAGQLDILVKKKDTVAAKTKYAEFSDAQKHSGEIWKKYAIENAKTSALSVFALYYAAGSGMPGIDSVFNLLAPKFKEMPTALAIKKKINQEHIVTIGQLAPLFSQPDTSGKTIALTSFRGKYVLVDFWASWCHPCRAESPYLVKAYKNYRAKNFEILSVSLDSKSAQSAWLKAIHDDNTYAWTQVSDLQGWKNAASTMYGINSIPQNYLVDPTGKIIAANLRGDELEKKLGEILGKM